MFLSMNGSGFSPARSLFSGPPMSRLLIAVSFLFLLGACTPVRRPQVIAGSIAVPQQWSGIVHIDGDVVIEETAVVHIAPGTEIVFLPPSPGTDRFVDHPHFFGSELIVRGRIHAGGTAAAPIVFRHVDPAAPAGSWGGINLVQTSGSSFRHCHFTQADSAVHSQDSTVTVSCSIFTGNRVAVRFHSSAIAITDNRLEKNGTAIRFHFGAPTISGNLLRENDKGMFITASPADYRISGNAIVASREAQVVLGEEVPDDVNLTGNFWGSVDPRQIEGGFFDGRRSDYLGKVRYAPFLSALPLSPEAACIR